MSYIEKVMEYFKIQIGTEIIGNKRKRIINITGKGLKNKTNKTLIVFYIIFTFVWALRILLIHGFISTNPDNMSIIKNIGILKFLSAITNPKANFLVLIATYIIVYIRIKLLYKIHEGKKQNLDFYRREVPSLLRPAHVRMLLNDGEVDSYSLSATIMDLIDRGFLGIRRKESNSNQIDKIQFFRKNSEELILYKKENKDYDKLFKFEKFIIEWFINKEGNGQEVSSSQLREAMARKKESENFEMFQAYVLVSFPYDIYYKKRNFTERYYKRILAGIIIGAIVPTVFLGTFLFTYALGIALFGSAQHILNDRGADEKDKWLDLKKFLIDYSMIEDKPAEMIAVWEFYLTYSIVFNISDVASKEIHDFFGEEIYYTDNYNAEIKYYYEQGEQIKGDIKYKDIIKPKDKEIFKEIIEDEEAAKKLYQSYSL